VVQLINESDDFHVGDAGTTEVIGGLVGPAGLVSFQYDDSDLVIDQDTNTTFGGDFYADGASPTVTKRGTGTLLLTGGMAWNHDDDVNFVVEEGVLSVDGNLKTDNGTNLTVKTNGTLKGKGTVGNVTTNGGIVAAGNSPGTLHTTSLTMDSDTIFEQEIAGPTAGTQYDQVIASGAVNLGNATLNLKPSYTPAAGQVFTIITGSSVTGTFKNLPNNSTVTVDGVQLRINYNATSVTLTYASGEYTPLAGTGSNMLLTLMGSVMLIGAATALAIRRQRSQTI
jgi:hypothetical protein